MHPSHPVITSKLESSHSLTSHPNVYHHRPFVISFISIASVPIHFFFVQQAPPFLYNRAFPPSLYDCPRRYTR
ncbi:hypothetical protein P692DRAFT_20324976 [Suillus brevipes Sb2]|nr:hypothetical protein P692DRAFT_20324976 [Suillus brevipes Sb2]